MNAEIIAVGSEMLTPERVDTNSLYLTGELNNLGVEVVTKCVIGDDRDRLADAVRRALLALGNRDPLRRPGPHRRRRDARSRGARRSTASWSSTPKSPTRWSGASPRMKRKMAEINKRQAFVIEGAAILPNDRGTAPGQWVEESGARGHAAARPAARTEGHVRAPVPAAPAAHRAAAGHPHRCSCA